MSGVPIDTKEHDRAGVFALRLQERGHLPTDEAAALRQAGFSDEQLVKIVALVGLNVFRSYFNLALGLGPTV